MKINPPKVIINENNPFEHALFGRKAVADSLTRLLRDVSENLVIFVNAPWGEGKTTFAKMWLADLLRQKLDVIYFDAYAADYFDDPFVAFSGEILGLVEKRAKDRGAVEREEFKKTAVEVGKRVAGLAVKLGVRAATLGIVDSTHLDELKKASKELASGLSEISADVVEKRINHYFTEKDSVAKFKKSLARLAAIVREEQGFPLTLIVDELDRCRPDFALALLERIKHLFDVEGVAFVLLVNRAQIEKYISIVYGDTDARGYLLKFASLFVDLPTQQSPFAFQYATGRSEYSRQLLGHYDFSKRVRDAGFLQQSLGLCIAQFALTLREIEKVFAILAIYFTAITRDQGTHEFLVAMLSCLKVKNPTLYERLRAGTVSPQSFFEETRLNQVKSSVEGLDSEWVRDYLRLCLMSEAEFEQAMRSEAETESNLRQVARMFGGRSMRNVIPVLCDRLDQFSLTPP